MSSGALRIALTYFIFCIAWIVISDQLLGFYHHHLSTSLYNLINNGRRFIFVATTGYLVYRMVKNHEKKLAENEILASLATEEATRLGTIITKINNIVIITDRNNYISWVNKAFERYTGYTFDEVAGYSPATFFAGAETDMQVLNSVLKSKNAHESFATELNCHNKHGVKFWVYGEYTPLFDERNEFNGYIAVYNDSTRLKQKEEETFLQNEKLKEVAWLSSHELRRPLANIIGLANLMKETTFMSEKEMILESLNQSAEELDKIVHTINNAVGEELDPVKKEPVIR